MKKIIFGIFAHPDDEAFGPSGTLLLEARSGAELHLVTLTDGSSGTNPDNVEDLGSVRLKEWRRGGDLMGATGMHHLGYRDGRLNNSDLVDISKRLIDLVRDVLEKSPPDTEAEFMTCDLNGVTGHIDHIVAARATCHAFYKLKESGAPVTRLRLACLPYHHVPAMNTDWIFMESGRTPEEIDEVVDAQSVREEIIAIMCAHHTQRSDCEAHIKQRGATLGIDYFIVKT